MKCLCYLGILKEGFSPYSSPVMLISRKITQDKRVVTDFRHLNVRIVKSNLAYPLGRDTLSVLSEVLSVLDLKDGFHSLRLLEDLKRYCSIINAFLYNKTNIWGRRQAFTSLQHGFLWSEENVVLYNFETPERYMGKCYDI